MLEAQAIGVAFAGVRALHEVSLTLAPAQVLGLIGPNGAGKTTLVNVLTGFQPPTTGAVLLAGASMRGLRSDQVRKRGVARTFQGARLFKALTVQENLEVTAVGLGLSRPAARAEAQRVLAWMGLQDLAHHTSEGLPYTDERRVGIARAIVGQPPYVLLDEPAAGMSEHEAADLQALITRIRQELGCGVLLIEHNVRLVLAICDDIVVLDSGEVIEQGKPEQIAHSVRVREAYMGSASSNQDIVI